MIVIQNEKDEQVSIKISKGTKHAEMLMGCVFLVEALKKSLNADTDTVIEDIKKIVDLEEGSENNE